MLEYSEYMTKPGHYGTLFELAISSKLFDFNAVVFMKQGDIFKSDIGVSDDDKNVIKPKLFILFTGSTYSGHFRLLKPSTIDCLKTSDQIPRGEYSIFKEDKSSFHLKKGLPQASVASQSDKIDSIKRKMLTCPFCCDSAKEYKGLTGLKIHISRMHPGETYKHIPVDQDNDFENFKDTLCNLRRKTRILKRIPRGARTLAAKKLCEIIDGSVRINDEKSWKKLMTFSYYALRVPKKSSKSLVTIVKKNLSNLENPFVEEEIYQVAIQI